MTQPPDGPDFSLADIARDSDDVRALLEFIERGDRPLLR